MTSAPTTRRTPSPSTDVDDGSTTTRLELKPQSDAATGSVDGGWWPRSRDLDAELPGLLAALAARLGPVERVSYHLGDWGGVAKRIKGGGGVVRMSGFHTQPADTVDVLGVGRRLTLLVVPPDASSQTARHALAAAGRSGNADSVASLRVAVGTTGPAVDRNEGESSS